MSKLIDVSLSTGTTIPFRATEAKNGNVYHAVLDPETGKPPATRTGGVLVHESVVGGEFPSYVEVLGVRVPLERGASEFGNAKVFANNVPVTFDGEPRLFSIKIGRGKQGFRVSGSINRPGGGGSKRVAASL